MASPDDCHRFQILSLSGGGVRGLYTVTILAELEQHLAEQSKNPDYRISQHFDLIAGTSIGGILALGLASGMKARDLRDLLDNERLTIFPRPVLRNIFSVIRYLRSLRLPFTSRYSANPLKKILTEVFKDQTIGDLHTPVIIPAVNATTGMVQMFKTPHHPDFKQDWKNKLVDVALATSAAPTYFPAHVFNDCIYVDGGLVANSPALAAIHEAGQFFNVKDMKSSVAVLQIGTMGAQMTLAPKASWLTPWFSEGYITRWGSGSQLIELTLSSNETLHNHVAGHIIAPDNFVILDEKPTQHQSSAISLDNASDRSANILTGRAKEKVKWNLNNQNLLAFFEHSAAKSVFHYGSQSNQNY
ncbi:CBASS cGAMP-activated phospholipase [Aeromonas caviae]|uniref:CBASS cGAMP-activated phospholipase n=1 Tax=Aeromonas caviae TaxID=648 RepID=UPI0026472BCD|nr:CBASS cGAMP-activated phospholipase [Aeromonas caviae]MDN6868907.1 CBASS cGAMP-activated phospholipase [Aeromonas caviae]